MTQKLGDGPIQPEYYDSMRAVASALDELFNEGLHGAERHTGFVLMVFGIDGLAKGDKRCNFISNGCDRKDIVALMKEMIARFEGQPEQSGHA